jgi:hypothetical protein
MNWARFDDRFPNHPKVLSLTDAEFRLHVSAICYCCDQLTDGYLADCVPSSLPKAPRAGQFLNAVVSLERSGLWERQGAGWVVHDFLDWNPSAQKVKAKKAARALAGRAGGLAKANRLPSKHASNCQSNRIGLLHAHPKQTPAPSPSPEDLPVDTDPKDPSGSASSVPKNGSGCVPCPSADVILNSDQVSTLEMVIPDWAIRILVVKFVAKNQADSTDLRTPTHWAKCCVSAVQGDWNNPRTRPSKTQPETASTEVLD